MGLLDSIKGLFGKGSDSANSTPADTAASSPAAPTPPAASEAPATPPTAPEAPQTEPAPAPTDQPPQPQQ